jgi:hypothetical protein
MSKESRILNKFNQHSCLYTKNSNGGDFLNSHGTTPHDFEAVKNSSGMKKTGSGSYDVSMKKAYPNLARSTPSKFICRSMGYFFF